MTSSEFDFERAHALHAAGDIDAAERAYHELLGREPGHSPALQYLGVIALGRGDFIQAAKLFSAALAISPGNPALRIDRASALNALGRYADALADCDAALATQPDHPLAHLNRAMALRGLGRLEDTLRAFQNATTISPDHHAALIGCGMALMELERPAEALPWFDRVVEISPDHAPALINRAAALRQLQRHEDALLSVAQVLRLAPDDPVALANLGDVLVDLGRLDEALAAYDRALAANSPTPALHNNRANTLRALERRAEALAGYERALAIAPQWEVPLANRANVLLELKRPRDAAAAFDDLLKSAPRHDFAAGMQAVTLLRCAEWAGHDARTAKIIDQLSADWRTARPLDLAHLVDNPALMRRSAALFAADYSRIPSRPVPSPVPSERIKIAFLSADFRDHPVGTLAAALFERLDRERYHVSAIAFGPADDGPTRRRIAAACDEFVDASARTDAAAADTLRHRGLDIAVDLTGYTQYCRPGILARRCAPAQVNFLGFPGTMAAGHMDYIVADRFLIPPGAEADYDERVVRLTDSALVADRDETVDIPVGGRAALGLPEDAIVYCNFGNAQKITPAMFEIWMRIMRRVGGSVLWLRHDGIVEDGLRREAAKRGVDPQRLIFAAFAPRPQHIGRQNLADMFLDTYPYNAHATAADALRAGLPVVARAGHSFAARASGSLSTSAGLPELIATSDLDYENLVVELSTHPERRAELKRRLARNLATHPAFDIGRYARDLESAFEIMSHRARNGLPPARIEVAGQR